LVSVSITAPAINHYISQACDVTRRKQCSDGILVLIPTNKHFHYQLVPMLKIIQAQ
jgi:hypothetical protein